jgi:hypothetical protein
MYIVKKLSILLCAIMILSMSACAAEPEPTPIPTPEPTATSVPPTATLVPTATIEPSKTPTVRPIGTLTATPRPSATPTNTATPRPSATPTNTATPTRTITPSPTATATQVPPDWITQSILVSSGRLYAMQSVRNPPPDANPVRLLTSDDSGTTWKPFSGGLPAAPGCVHNINLDYAIADALYASTCQGLYRWKNGAWSLVSSQETGMVAIVYQQASTIWATGFKSSDSPIMRSDDSGKTWANAATGLVHFSGIANLGIDPRDANTLYAIINPKYAGSYLRRGTAAGLWQTIPTPLKSAQIDTGMTIDGTTGNLYVTAYDGAKARWQLWRSANANDPDIGKISWQMINEFGANVFATVLASGATPQGLAIYVRLMNANCNPSAGIQCYPIVQRTLDNGKTWTTIHMPGF